MAHERPLVLAAVAVVALAGVAGAAAPNAEFAESQYEASQTETAILTVELNDTDTANLAVGSESAGYTLNGTLVDGDGDGTVAVEFIVQNAGTAGPTLLGGDGDAVENVSESEFHDPPLAPGAYRIAVSATGEQPSDVGRFTVEEPAETTNVTTTYAPTNDDLAEPTSASGTATTRSAETGPAPTTENASNGGSPGFSVVAGLLGLAGAALLAARR